MKMLSRYSRTVSLISVAGLITGGALVAQTSKTSGAVGSSDAIPSSLSSATDPLNASIQSADYGSHAQLANDIEQRLDSQKESSKSLKTEGKRLEGQAKSDFKTAYDELETREKDLKRSVKEVRTVREEKWDSARSELASNFQAYMAAFARVQMQVGAGVSFPSSSSPNTNDSTRNGRTAPGSSSSDKSPAPSTSP